MGIKKFQKANRLNLTENEISRYSNVYEKIDKCIEFANKRIAILSNYLN